MAKLNTPGKRAKEETGASNEMRPSVLTNDMTEIFRREPERFAREVLGSQWWQAQTEIAHLLANHRRVAVKAANGVGKTFLAADIVLWFLFCHRPSVVLTTAPTWRQVESLLWEEIHRRFRRVNALAEIESGRIALDGTLLQTRLKVAEGHFAMGLSTDEPVRFQGFHAENLLIVLDEACGVPEEIWDAVEGICVGGNNRVLAISNPLAPVGRFHSLFRQDRWQTFTISALDHPNVLGVQPLIPGAITREAVEDRIAVWCELSDETDKEAIVWDGKWFRPQPQFRVRVLGEFPHSAEDSLYSTRLIDEAIQRNLTPGTPCILAVDIARYGSDETVFAIRRGDVVMPLTTVRGQALTETARQIQRIAQQERADAVMIDAIGMGAGVEDMLKESNLANVFGVKVGGKAFGTGENRFLNLRAQTFWRLRERMERGDIVLPDDAVLREQLASLRYHFAGDGRIQIQSKEEMRKAGLSSPDRADAVSMLFCPQAELMEISGAVSLSLFERFGGVHWGKVQW